MLYGLLGLNPSVFILGYVQVWFATLGHDNGKLPGASGYPDVIGAIPYYARIAAALPFICTVCSASNLVDVLLLNVSQFVMDCGAPPYPPPI